jgi:hypothetical protein
VTGNGQIENLAANAAKGADGNSDNGANTPILPSQVIFMLQDMACKHQNVVLTLQEEEDDCP